MTEKDIHDATETFSRYGVPAERIFDEIMRARYLDYALFQNPENQQYGISIEDLYENMKKTSDRLGMYGGDADTYVRAYTLALRVDPLVFAPEYTGRDEEMEALMDEVMTKAENAGDTVLFFGVEKYLSCVSRIFDRLSNKRLAFAVESPAWKKRLQLLFPRCRLMLSSELAEDKVKYDYIFAAEEERLSSCYISLLKEKGSMDILIPYEMMLDERIKSWGKELQSLDKLSAYYDVACHEREFAFLRLSPEGEGSIAFGNALLSHGQFKGNELFRMTPALFSEADEWNFDVYAYSAFPGLQAILAGNVLHMEHTAGSAFESVKPCPLPAGRYDRLHAGEVRDSGIRKGQEAPALLEGGEEGVLLEAGDLALSLYKGKIHAAVVPEGKKFLAGENVYALRSLGKYTSWYMKLYLDGPVGQMFLETMRLGEGFCFTLTRFLRMPLPLSDEETIIHAEKMAKEAVLRLAEAEENWQSIKRSAVGLMMGHFEE